MLGANLDKPEKEKEQLVQEFMQRWIWGLFHVL